MLIAENDEEPFQFKYNILFSPELINITVLLLSIMFCIQFTFYGVQQTFPITLNRLQLRSLNLQPIQIIKGSLLTGTGNIVGALIAGILSEVQSFGRKNTLIISSLIMIVILALGITYIHYFTYFIAFFNIFTCLVLTVSDTFPLEIYPTKIREKSVGLLFTFKRICSFTSNIFFAYLNSHSNIFLPYYVSFGLILFLMISAFFINYESYGKELDSIPLPKTYSSVISSKI